MYQSYGLLHRLLQIIFFDLLIIHNCKIVLLDVNFCFLFPINTLASQMFLVITKGLNSKSSYRFLVF